MCHQRRHSLIFERPGGGSELNFHLLAGGHRVIFLYVTSIFQPPPLPPPDIYCMLSPLADELLLCYIRK